MIFLSEIMTSTDFTTAPAKETNGPSAPQGILSQVGGTEIHQEIQDIPGGLPREAHQAMNGDF